MVNVDKDRASSSVVDKVNSVSANIVLATYLLANSMFAAPAMATTTNYDYDNGISSGAASSILISARSGGRAGGRPSSTARPMQSTSRSYAPARSTTVIVTPGYIAPSPVIISPFGYGGGFGYNPLGGMGMGYALGASSNIGNEIRDNNQEREIIQNKMELEQSKSREAQLEQRLKALEQTQRN
jgi:hypothetical protein